MKIKQRGFTIVELLVVIAIIGILAGITFVNIASSRASARDAKRIADIRQISTALDLFYGDNNRYPTPSTPSNTGPNPSDGPYGAWSTYSASWPTVPTPPDGTCDLTNNAYTYTQTNSGRDYSITFCLGKQIGNFSAGTHTATSTGIQTP